MGIEEHESYVECHLCGHKHSPYSNEFCKAILADRIRTLEAENADLKCSEASVTDLANTYCREHQLPESGEPKDCINQLAWKCARLEQENERLKGERERIAKTTVSWDTYQKAVAECDVVRVRLEAELNGVLHVVQKHQPAGSPIPGDSATLTEWILGTLEAKNAALRDRVEVLIKDNAMIATGRSNIAWQNSDLRAENERLKAQLAIRTGWQKCKTHGDIKADYAWGCPDCVDELKRENERLKAENAALKAEAPTYASMIGEIDALRAKLERAEKTLKEIMNYCESHYDHYAFDRASRYFEEEKCQT